MGIMVYSLLWVMQELYHQPCVMNEELRKAPCGAHLEFPRTEVEQGTWFLFATWG